MTSGIYVIKNKLNGKEYYGQGYNVEKRMWQSHYECSIIYKAIKKYGKENFERNVILYCEESKLDYYEIGCIRIFHSHVSEGGYNVSFGGNTPSKRLFGKDNPSYGSKRSYESRRLMRLAKLGTHPSKEALENMSLARSGKGNPNYGKAMSDGQKMKIGIANKGHFHSEEWKREHSRKMSGENHPMYGKKTKNTSSQYLGVYKKIMRGKEYWIVNIKMNKKIIFYKTCKTEIEAALLHDKYVIENNLNRSLNFS